MNQKQLIQKFYKINQAVYDKAKSALPSHGPWHHLRVLNNALVIAKDFKRVDYEVLIPACLLHDMGGAYFPGKKDYHDADKKMAEKILKNSNLKKEKIGKIVDAVANHGSDPKYRSRREPAETTILRDADKLEAFGPVGVARIIMARSIQGDGLKQIAEKYHGGRLQRKWKSITIRRARIMGKKNYEYSLDYFARLLKIL